MLSAERVPPGFLAYLAQQEGFKGLEALRREDLSHDNWSLPGAGSGNAWATNWLAGNCEEAARFLQDIADDWGIDCDRLAIEYGRFFIVSAAPELGYDQLLRICAPSLPGMLGQLTDIHLYLADGIAPSPTIWVEQVKPSSFLVHCCSASPRYVHWLQGIMDEAARQYYNMAGVSVKLVDMEGQSSNGHQVMEVTAVPGSGDFTKHCEDDARLAKLSGDSVYSLDASSFYDLFPFHLILDSQCRVVQAGSALLEIHPELATPRVHAASAFFQICHPTPLDWAFEELVMRSGSSIVLASRERLQLKGTLVRSRIRSEGGGEEEVARFIGVPVLEGLVEMKSLGLYFNCLPHHNLSAENMLTRELLEMTAADYEEQIRFLQEENDLSKAACSMLREQLLAAGRGSSGRAPYAPSSQHPSPFPGTPADMAIQLIDKFMLSFPLEAINLPEIVMVRDSLVKAGSNINQPLMLSAQDLNGYTGGDAEVNQNLIDLLAGNCVQTMDDVDDALTAFGSNVNTYGSNVVNPVRVHDGVAAITFGSPRPVLWERRHSPGSAPPIAETHSLGLLSSLYSSSGSPGPSESADLKKFGRTSSRLSNLRNLSFSGLLPGIPTVLKTSSRAVDDKRVSDFNRVQSQPSSQTLSQPSSQPSSQLSLQPLSQLSLQPSSQLSLQPSSQPHRAEKSLAGSSAEPYKHHTASRASSSAGQLLTRFDGPLVSDRCLRDTANIHGNHVEGSREAERGSAAGSAAGAGSGAGSITGGSPCQRHSLLRRFSTTIKCLLSPGSARKTEQQGGRGQSPMATESSNNDFAHSGCYPEAKLLPTVDDALFDNDGAPAAEDLFPPGSGSSPPPSVRGLSQSGACARLMQGQLSTPNVRLLSPSQGPAPLLLPSECGQSSNSASGSGGSPLSTPSVRGLSQSGACPQLMRAQLLSPNRSAHPQSQGAAVPVVLPRVRTLPRRSNSYGLFPVSSPLASKHKSPRAVLSANAVLMASGLRPSVPRLGRQSSAGHGVRSIAELEDERDPIVIRLLKAPSDVLSIILGQVDDWQFDMFALSDATGGRPLSVLAFSLFKRADIIGRFDLDEKRLARFLMRIEDGYPPNPYHCRCHAADVLRLLHVIATRAGLIDQASPVQVEPGALMAALSPGKGLPRPLMPHDEHGLASARTVLSTLTVYLAAIIHDFDHRGVNNQFLIQTCDPLAILYNDASPMENHHCAAAFSLLRDERYNFLQKMPMEVWMVMRTEVIHMVLGTDMKQHFGLVSLFKSKAVHMGTSEVSASQSGKLSALTGGPPPGGLNTLSPLPRVQLELQDLPIGLLRCNSLAGSGRLPHRSSIASEQTRQLRSTKSISVKSMLSESSQSEEEERRSSGNSSGAALASVRCRMLSSSPPHSHRNAGSPSPHVPLPSGSKESSSDRCTPEKKTSCVKEVANPQSGGEDLSVESFGHQRRISMQDCGRSMIRQSIASTHRSRMSLSQGSAMVGGAALSPNRSSYASPSASASLPKPVVDAPKPAFSIQDPETKEVVWKIALKCADLGNLTTSKSVARKWVLLLEEEMFRQGDRERIAGLPISALMDRSKGGVTKSQPGFFNVVALPLFSSFVQSFPNAAPMLEGAKANLAMWMEEGTEAKQG